MGKWSSGDVNKNRTEQNIDLYNETLMGKVG